jgi:hypothetical protein
MYFYAHVREVVQPEAGAEAEAEAEAGEEADLRIQIILFIIRLFNTRDRLQRQRVQLLILRWMHL